MTTPELPPLPPGTEYIAGDNKHFRKVCGTAIAYSSDEMRAYAQAYGDARAAAAVLAEQEKAEAMRTKAQELVDALDGSYWSSWQTTAGFSAQWEALRAAIRAEPKEQQP